MSAWKSSKKFFRRCSCRNGSVEGPQPSPPHSKRGKPSHRREPNYTPHNQVEMEEAPTFHPSIFTRSRYRNLKTIGSLHRKGSKKSKSPLQRDSQRSNETEADKDDNTPVGTYIPKGFKLAQSQSREHLRLVPRGPMSPLNGSDKAPVVQTPRTPRSFIGMPQIPEERPHGEWGRVEGSAGGK